MTILLITSYPYLTRQIAERIESRLASNKQLIILETKGPFCNHLLGTNKYKKILLESSIEIYNANSNQFVINRLRDLYPMQTFLKKARNFPYFSSIINTLINLLLYFPRMSRYIEYCLRNRKWAKSDSFNFQNKVDELNPNLIILLTDQFQYMNILNSIKYRDRTILLAPCLVRRDNRSFLAKLESLVFNKLIGLSCINDHDWGTRFKGRYIGVWNLEEIKQFKIKVPVEQIGSFFFLKNRLNIERTNNSCLVVLHEFNSFIESDFEKYRKFLRDLFTTYPLFKFKLRYHPRNELFFDFESDNVTYDNDQDFNFKNLENFRFVISSFSALSVEIGFMHPRTALIELSNYDKMFHHFNSPLLFEKIYDLESFNSFINSGNRAVEKKFAARQANLSTSDTLVKFLNKKFN